MEDVLWNYIDLDFHQNIWPQSYRLKWKRNYAQLTTVNLSQSANGTMEFDTYNASYAFVLFGSLKARRSFERMKYCKFNWKTNWKKKTIDFKVIMRWMNKIMNLITIQPDRPKFKTINRQNIWFHNDFFLEFNQNRLYHFSFHTTIKQTYLFTCGIPYTQYTIHIYAITETHCIW